MKNIVDIMVHRWYDITCEQRKQFIQFKTQLWRNWHTR